MSCFENDFKVLRGRVVQDLAMILLEHGRLHLCLFAKLEVALVRLSESEIVLFLGKSLKDDIISLYHFRFDLLLLFVLVSEHLFVIVVHLHSFA